MKRFFNPIVEMQSRGMIQQMTRFFNINTSPDLVKKFDSTVVKGYAGFDPTATSLHVGNLLSIIALLHLHRCGHGALALVGGATGAIGDPSGRSTERNALDKKDLLRNMSAITSQVQRLFENGTRYLEENNLMMVNEPIQVKIVNNLEWFQNMTLLDFMDMYGRHARVNAMIARDSVKNRLESSQGISFTEFSYQLFQSVDFLHLTKENVQLQLGGSDQWGNIVSGIDLIQKTNSESSCYGLVMPLLTSENGEKFGKSAGNAVWLDPELLSTFDFYQFFRRCSDEMLPMLLKFFTFTPIEQLNEILAKHSTNKDKGIGQKYLAEHVTWLVHGRKEAESAQVKSMLLYEKQSTNSNGLFAKRVIEAFKGDPRLIQIPRDKIISSSLIEVFLKCNIFATSSQAIKACKSGSLYLNHEKLGNLKRVVVPEMLIDNSLLLIRKGKAMHVVLILK